MPQAVANKLMEACSSILDSLNLSYRILNDEKATTGSDSLTISANTLASQGDANRLEPVRARDFEIFHQLVEFLRDLLKLDLQVLVPWLHPLAAILTGHSTTHPQISGFYRMLTSVVKIASKNNMFDLRDGDPADMEVDDTQALTREFAELIRRFISEIMRELHQYKEELLVACIEFVLSVPIRLVTTDLSLVADALNRALQFGMTHFELAEIAMSALERWESECHSDVLEVVPKVLPAFDNYIRTLPDTDTVDTKTAKRKRRTGSANVQMKAQPLIELQERILTFLGKVVLNTNPDLRKKLF